MRCPKHRYPKGGPVSWCRPAAGAVAQFLTIAIIQPPSLSLAMGNCAATAKVQPPLELGKLCRPCAYELPFWILAELHKCRQTQRPDDHPPSTTGKRVEERSSGRAKETRHSARQPRESDAAEAKRAVNRALRLQRLHTTEICACNGSEGLAIRLTTRFVYDGPA